MRIPLGAVLLLCLPAAAQVAPLSRSTAPISLYTSFQYACPAEVTQSLQRELAAIMEPAGIDFQWRSLDSPDDRKAVSAELAVIGFLGACRMGLDGPYVGEGPLGWTHITDQELLPFVDVNCDRIRAVLRSETKRLSLPARERALGRAMARVVAHELYHVFANTRRHARHGIAKDYLTAGELVEGELRFGPAELAAMRDNGLRWLFAHPVTAAAGH